MKEFLQKHWITIATLVVSLVLSIIVGVIETISVFEGIICGLITLLIITFVFDFDRYLEKIVKSQELQLNQLKHSAVYDFDSVDKCAIKVGELIQSGENHTVDFVSLDTKIRTQVKDARRPMYKLLDDFVSKKNIKLRYLTTISAKNFETIAQFIKKSQKKGNDSNFALCVSTIPFASFYIIDNMYLVIRTPYDTSTPKHYCIVENEVMIRVYQSWFDMLWKASEIIDNKEVIDKVYSQIKSDISEADASRMEDLKENIKIIFGE